MINDFSLFEYLDTIRFRKWIAYLNIYLNNTLKYKKIKYCLKIILWLLRLDT